MMRERRQQIRLALVYYYLRDQYRTRWRTQHTHTKQNKTKQNKTKQTGMQEVAAINRSIDRSIGGAYIYTVALFLLLYFSPSIVSYHILVDIILICPFAFLSRSFIHSFIHSLPLAHSFIHSFIHTHTHTHTHTEAHT